MTRLPTALAGAGVLLQIAYPLADGGVRDTLTVGVVVLLALAGVAHAAAGYGRPVAAALLLSTAVAGFAIEVVGVHTAMPFGDYRYRDALGPQLLDVPLVVAFAWTMLAWPAAIAARHVVRTFPARVIVGAWALVAGDLFLDPQMVSAGYWRWRDPGPHLPGVDSVPLTNLAGWTLVALGMSWGIQTALRHRRPADDRMPIALYLWLWLGWTLALAVFLDLPAAAAWGALGMGAVAAPLGYSLLHAHRNERGRPPPGERLAAALR